MGFYGNITNTSKTQFQFDKIYANRYDMERQRGIDGIYAGRYVLIEYDTKFQFDDLQIVFIKPSGIYTEDKEDKNFEVKPGVVSAGDVVFTADVEKDPSGGTIYNNVTYYEVQIMNGEVTLKELASTSNGPNYTINYNIDINKFGAGRGYDSTVWQKTYMDGQEKYIMIAELNSVVPTFDVSADAPTMAPLVPHFDTQSTDIYYKLHWQPSWGFRIAEAAPNSGRESPLGENSSTDDRAKLYPSDVTVSYDVTKYNPSTGKNDVTKQVTYNGAVFFNKAGFNSLKHTHYDNEKFPDEIAIRPSGKSGQTYNKHNGTFEVEAMPDIQEMRVILPSLGNALCDLWDMAYGNNPDNDNTRYQDIEWKDAVSGKENEDIGGMTRNLETIAGCINSVHDLMGMIITESIPQDSELEEAYKLNRIYKDKNGYKRIQRVPKYTAVSGLVIPNKQNYTSDQAYNEAYKQAVDKVLTSAIEKVFYAVKMENGKQIARRINPYIANNLDQGEILSYRNGYNYYYAYLDGFANNLSTINGLILQLKNLIESDDSESRNKETVQGVVNTLNDIINMFEDLIPGEPVIVDASGKVTSANWTTKQTLTYTNLGGAAAPSGNVAENQWIQMSIDKNDKLITLQHSGTHTARDTATSSNKNGTDNPETGLNKNNAEVAASKDELKLYTPILDNCGHVVGKNTETVTLPYGYKHLESTDYSLNTDTDLYSTIDTDKKTILNPSVEKKVPSNAEAVNTQDTVSFQPINKWIQSKVNAQDETSKSIVQLAHSLQPIDTAKNPDSDLNASVNDKIQNTITLQDISADLAGHITAIKPHQYTLPYGFKTIQSALQTTENNTAGPDVNNASIKADNTQDTLTVSPSNKWIRIFADTSNDTLSIGHEIHDFDDKASSGNYYGLTQDETIGTLNKDKKFEVPCLSFDKAGHIVGARTHTVELPENFSSIKVTVNDDADKKKTGGTNGDIKADSLTDQLTIAEGNRWVNIDADSEKDTIVFSHYVNDISNEEKATDYNSSTTNNFTVQEINYDEAGHISGVNTHTYTLPDSLKTITVKNGGSNVVNVTPTISNGDLTATGLTDSVIVDIGNRWINMVADTGEKKVTVYHAAPGEQTNSTYKLKSENEGEPSFGANIVIPEIKYDEAGHISGVDTHNIKLPEPSINTLSTGDSKVVTSISMDSSSGAITQNNNDISNLKLTNYEVKPAGSSDSENIYTGDSINQAFNKIENKIVNIKTDAPQTIQPGQMIKEWVQKDGKISINKYQDIQVTNTKGKNNEIITTAISKVEGLEFALATIEQKLLGGSDFRDSENNPIENLTLSYLLQQINEIKGILNTPTTA